MFPRKEWRIVSTSKSRVSGGGEGASRLIGASISIAFNVCASLIPGAKSGIESKVQHELRGHGCARDFFCTRGSRRWSQDAGVVTEVAITRQEGRTRDS